MFTFLRTHATHRGLLLGLSSASLLCAALTTHADDGGSFSDLITQGKASGYLRSYEWSNNNFYNTNISNNIFVVGGKLKAETGTVDGFSAGAAFYTSHTPQSTYNDPTSYDPTLGTNIDTLGESYLNYHNDSVNLRVGRQAIDTPFANGADYRMIPALYQGETFSYTPSQDFSLTFGRISRYKSWTSATFDRTNNETAGPFQKSGPGFLNFPDMVTGGFWYAGAHDALDMKGEKLSSQLWYYDFFDIAHLVFLDEKLTFNLQNDFKPFVGLQYANEQNEGAALFGTVNSTPYGLQMGADFGKNNLTAAAIHIPAHPGTFNNGGLASPYTDGYGSASLFTGNMLFPTEGLGSGNAVQLSGSHAFDEDWSSWASYNQFNQTASAFAAAQTINEYVVSVNYNAHGYFKGWKISDMLGYATLAGNSNHFTQNRLMAQYGF